MPARTPITAALALPLGATLSLALSPALGLPLLPGPMAPAVAATADPAVGECRDLTRAQVDAGRTDAPPVDCSGPHRTETFAVGTVPASFPGPATASVRQRIDAVEQACTRERMDAYLGLQADFPNRFEAIGAFPSPAQWDAGARWVRCDLVLREALGFGRWRGPAPALVAASDPAVFRFCTPSERYYGIPDARRLRAVACGKPASQWILVATPELGAVWSRYPGAKVIARKARAACEPLKHAYPGTIAKASERGWFYVVPTATGWARGDRDAKCFVPLRQYLESPAPAASPPVPPAA